MGRVSVSVIAALTLLFSWFAAQPAPANEARLPAPQTIGRPLVDDIGACCLADGSCRLISQAECYESGGTGWVEGEDCAGDCAIAGVCCLGDGTCALVTQTACESGEGAFWEQGTECGTEICKAQMYLCYAGTVYLGCGTGAQCRIRGGNRLVPVRACNQGHKGACCVGGECILTFAPECDSLGGLFQGPGSECEPAVCDTVPEPGRCCFPDGDCRALLNSECVQQGGVSWSPEVACLTPCPPAGACCLPGGGCAVLIAEACERIDGRFQGGGLECETTTCEAVPVTRRSWGSIKMIYR